MKIKNLRVAEENFSSITYSLTRKAIATGIVIGLVTTSGISKSIEKSQSIQNPQKNQEVSSEFNKDEHPTLKVVLKNPNAIKTEKASILIVNQDNLLIQYVEGYSDGFVDIESMYLIPGDECIVTAAYNDENRIFNFQVGEDEDSKTEYKLIVDCETGEMRVEKETKEIENIPHL